VPTRELAIQVGSVLAPLASTRRLRHALLYGGRGLDVPEVAQVINYELPESAEWFTHRVGRTGRMGRAGRAITFLTPDDATKWRQFEKALGRRLERRRWAHAGEASAAVSERQQRRRAAARGLPEHRGAAAYDETVSGESSMGERARGKDKGKVKKSPKAAKVGRRPHELQQQMRDALKRPTDASG
jgi:superfamily II DNA/RNA helicase